MAMLKEYSLGQDNQRTLMTFKEKMLKYGKINDCPIIDMHAHWYKFYGAALPTTSLEDSLKLFEDSNVQKVIISSHLACESPIFGNQASIDIAKQKPDIFRVLFNINPKESKTRLSTI